MKIIYRRVGDATLRVKTAFGLKTAPDCRIYRPERMSALPDHMAAGTNPKAGWKSGCSGFHGFAADGFGLSVHKPAAQTTRDVIFTRDTRRRTASGTALSPNRKVIG
jgi:hypothetical protein